MTEKKKPTELPPTKDGQHQGGCDCQNEHPPLINAVCNCDEDPVSKRCIQACDYTTQGSVFNTDPFDIWGMFSKGDLRASLFVSNLVSVCCILT